MLSCFQFVSIFFRENRFWILSCTVEILLDVGYVSFTYSKWKFARAKNVGATFDRKFISTIHSSQRPHKFPFFWKSFVVYLFGCSAGCMKSLKSEKLQKWFCVSFSDRFVTLFVGLLYTSPAFIDLVLFSILFPGRNFFWSKSPGHDPRKSRFSWIFEFLEKLLEKVLRI